MVLKIIISYVYLICFNQKLGRYMISLLGSWLSLYILLSLILFFLFFLSAIKKRKSHFSRKVVKKYQIFCFSLFYFHVNRIYYTFFFLNYQKKSFFKKAIKKYLVASHIFCFSLFYDKVTYHDVNKDCEFITILWQLSAD